MLRTALTMRTRAGLYFIIMNGKETHAIKRNQILSALRGLALNLSAAGAADLTGKDGGRPVELQAQTNQRFKQPLTSRRCFPVVVVGRRKGEPDTGFNHLGFRCVKPRLP